MDELRAYLLLMIAERQRLASVVSREHRPLTPQEIKALARLTTAIDGMRFTLAEFSAPQPAGPSPAGSQPGASAEYRTVAGQTLDKLRDEYRLSSQYAAEYGRWLIATIAALHLGGIYIVSLSTTLDVVQRERGIWVLTVGVMLILFAGLAAWANWGAASLVFAKWTDAKMLVDPAAWPKEDAMLNARMKWTYRASLGLGLASALCVPLAVALSIGTPG